MTLEKSQYYLWYLILITRWLSRVAADLWIIRKLAIRLQEDDGASYNAYDERYQHSFSLTAVSFITWSRKSGPVGRDYRMVSTGRGWHEAWYWRLRMLFVKGAINSKDKKILWVFLITWIWVNHETSPCPFEWNWCHALTNHKL